jgi:hypothetical protein
MVVGRIAVAEFPARGELLLDQHNWSEGRTLEVMTWAASVQRSRQNPWKCALSSTT